MEKHRVEADAIFSSLTICWRTTPKTSHSKRNSQVSHNLTMVLHKEYFPGSIIGSPMLCSHDVRPTSLCSIFLPWWRMGAIDTQHIRCELLASKWIQIPETLPKRKWKGWRRKQKAAAG
jgi:hypothetical protein